MEFGLRHMGSTHPIGHRLHGLHRDSINCCLLLLLLGLLLHELLVRKGVEVLELLRLLLLLLLLLLGLLVHMGDRSGLDVLLGDPLLVRCSLLSLLLLLMLELLLLL